MTKPLCNGGSRGSAGICFIPSITDNRAVYSVKNVTFARQKKYPDTLINTSSERINAQKATGKLFRSYAYPAMLNMVVMALYNIIDRVFIGQGAGPLAICGLALTLPCVSLLSTTGTLTGVGASSRISAAISLGNKQLASNILGNALFLNTLLSVLLILLSFCYLDEILLAFGGSEQTIPYAHDYLTILIPGSLLTNLNFTCCHAIRAADAARKSMMIILIGVIANIILDPVLIFGFQLGIKGAAIATVMSMAISSILIFTHLHSRQNIFRLDFHCFIPKISLLMSLIGIGMAAFIMNITTGMVNIIMNRYLEKYGGDDAIGAYGIISSYSILVSMLLMGICQAMQPLAGYQYATGRTDLARYTLATAIRIGSLIALAAFLLGEGLAPWLVGIFTSNATLQSISERGLTLTFLAMPLIGFQTVVTSFFQSIRQAPKAIAMNISRQFLFLIPALGFFSSRWGLSGIWLAIPFADFMATLIAFFFLVKTPLSRSSLSR